MTVKDRIYFNLYFYDERDSTKSTIIVPSREALHVIDTKSQRIVQSDVFRRYRNFIPRYEE
jgi:hypothetical protein